MGKIVGGRGGHFELGARGNKRKPSLFPSRKIRKRKSHAQKIVFRGCLKSGLQDPW